MINFLMIQKSKNKSYFSFSVNRSPTINSFQKVYITKKVYELYYIVLLFTFCKLQFTVFP